MNITVEINRGKMSVSKCLRLCAFYLFFHIDLKIYEQLIGNMNEYDSVLSFYNKNKKLFSVYDFAL